MATINLLRTQTIKNKPMQALENYVRKSIKEHPDLKDGILDLYYLCLSEIESEESEENEKSLCINSIDELIEEKNEKKV